MARGRHENARRLLDEASSGLFVDYGPWEEIPKAARAMALKQAAADWDVIAPMVLEEAAKVCQAEYERLHGVAQYSKLDAYESSRATTAQTLAGRIRALAQPDRAKPVP